MTIDIASIFKAIGPAASIIFAAWIFMGFLQTRYDAALDRYLALVATDRGGVETDERRGNLHDSILVYKHRCDLMNVAGVIGLVSAMLLTSTLMIGELALLLPGSEALKLTAIIGALVGLALVVVASAIVVYESLIIHRQLQAELLDLPDLAHGIGQEPGKIGDTARPKRYRA